jgi:putative transposase
MVASDDQQPVQALGTDRADPALRVGVRIGRLDGCQQDLGALGAEHVVEGAAELGVPIAQHELHKLRNVIDRLPDTVASTVAKRMRVAYRNPDPLVAEADLEALARSWTLNRSYPGAAGSLWEGLAETLTIGRLGVPPALARTLRSTNSIESMIEICRDHAANVKRWQDGQMVLRWIAAAWARPASSSAASTATCTCQHCAPALGGFWRQW